MFLSFSKGKDGVIEGCRLNRRPAMQHMVFQSPVLNKSYHFLRIDSGFT